MVFTEGFVGKGYVSGGNYLVMPCQYHSEAPRIRANYVGRWYDVQGRCRACGFPIKRPAYRQTSDDDLRGVSHSDDGKYIIWQPIPDRQEQGVIPVYGAGSRRTTGAFNHQLYTIGPGTILHLAYRGEISKRRSSSYLDPFVADYWVHWDGDDLRVGSWEQVWAGYQRDADLDISRYWDYWGEADTYRHQRAHGTHPGTDIECWLAQRDQLELAGD